MATQEVYKKDFAAELLREYGAEKLTDERITFMWSRLKNFPDNILRRCAREIIARNTYFPGVDKAIAISGEVFNEFKKEQPKALNHEIDCHVCGGGGGKVVDGFIFRCPCPAGKMNYPSNALYTGQTPFIERISETSTEHVRETRTHIYRRDKQTGKLSFTIKRDPWRDHNPNPSRGDFDGEYRQQKVVK